MGERERRMALEEQLAMERARRAELEAHSPARSLAAGGRSPSPGGREPGGSIEGCAAPSDGRDRARAAV